MEKLTAMQQKIYDFIADAIRNQGYPPSVREIGEAVGLKSPSTSMSSIWRNWATSVRAAARAAP